MYTLCDTKESDIVHTFLRKPLGLIVQSFSTHLSRSLLFRRANVPKNKAFSKYNGNSEKISAHILKLDRPYSETNHDILRLAEYRFIFEEIDNNRIPSKCRY